MQRTLAKTADLGMFASTPAGVGIPRQILTRGCFAPRATIYNASGVANRGSSWTSHAFYHADGGGNVTFLSPSTYSGTMTRYSYDAYGRSTSATGPLATANVYRFSSKELHAASGHYYYGYRFYDPQAQRWINRDPLGEAGGMNLYGFVGNGPVGAVDRTGLTGWGGDGVRSVHLTNGRPVERRCESTGLDRGIAS